MFIGERYYIDNSNYDCHLENGTELLKTLRWLFLENKNDHNRICLSGKIAIFDFMTCVVHLTKISSGPIADLAIENFISELATGKNDPWGDLGFGQEITYIKDRPERICCKRIYNGTIQAILWTGYVYFRLRYLSTKETEDLTNANNILSAFMNHANLDENSLKNNYLYLRTKETFDKYSRTPNESGSEFAGSIGCSVIDNNTIDKLNKRISELENQLSECKDELSALKNEIEDQVEQINPTNKVKLDTIYKILIKAGAKIDNEQYGSKTAAANIMTSITDIDFQTCKNFCSSPHASRTEHKKDMIKIETEFEKINLMIKLGYDN